MQYRPLTQVTDPCKMQELADVLAEVQYTFGTHSHMLPANAKGLSYAQAIVDEVFARVLPHRGYRVTARLEGSSLRMDIEEPIETVTGVSTN